VELSAHWNLPGVGNRNFILNKRFTPITAEQHSAIMSLALVVNMVINGCKQIPTSAMFVLLFTMVMFLHNFHLPRTTEYVIYYIEM
jgi:hypothetical protein